MSGGSRRNADGALLAALTEGATIRECASRAGLSEATAFRRLREPAFRHQLDEQRAALLVLTRRRIADTSLRAAAALSELLEEGRPDNVRLGAARTVLNLTLNGRSRAWRRLKIRFPAKT